MAVRCRSGSISSARHRASRSPGSGDASTWVSPGPWPSTNRRSTRTCRKWDRARLTTVRRRYHSKASGFRRSRNRPTSRTNASWTRSSARARSPVSRKASRTAPAACCRYSFPSRPGSVTAGSSASVRIIMGCRSGDAQVSPEVAPHPARLGLSTSDDRRAVVAVRGPGARLRLRTHVMGVLNVTPDSFSDGGLFLDPEAAVRRGIELAAEGADVIDVGGESTRPGSDPVPAEVEMDRVVPVIKRLAAEVDVPLSIDTRKPEVARAGLDAGAAIVNDISGGRDARMLEVVADTGAGLVLMHMLGDPKTMQAEPRYDDVVAEVKAYLGQRVEAAVQAGIDRDRLCVDPGIGFGKKLEHNLELLRNVDAFAELGRPVLVGPSRKSFLGKLLGAEVDDRLEGTAAAVAWLAARGAHILRVHDVREMVRVVRVVDAIVHHQE